MFIKQDVSFKEAKRLIEEGGVVFTEIDEDRAVGKTTAILAYSVWSGKPVVTSSRVSQRMYREYNPNAKVLHISEVLGNGLVRDGILIDESIDLATFKELRRDYGISNISGFMRNQGGFINE